MAKAVGAGQQRQASRPEGVSSSASAQTEAITFVSWHYSKCPRQKEMQPCDTQHKRMAISTLIQSLQRSAPAHPHPPKSCLSIHSISLSQRLEVPGHTARCCERNKGGGVQEAITHVGFTAQSTGQHARSWSNRSLQPLHFILKPFEHKRQSTTC